MPLLFFQIAKYLLLKFLLSFFVLPLTKLRNGHRIKIIQCSPKCTPYICNLSHFNSGIFKIQLLNFILFHKRRHAFVISLLQMPTSLHGFELGTVVFNKIKFFFRQFRFIYSFKYRHDISYGSILPQKYE